MALADLEQYIRLIPVVRGSPGHYRQSSYFLEADVVYNNFKKPSLATISEITDDDIIIRYQGKEDNALTVLHANQRE